jgi:hypothetical protein
MGYKATEVSESALSFQPVKIRLGTKDATISGDELLLRQLEQITTIPSTIKLLNMTE